MLQRALGVVVLCLAVSFSAFAQPSLALPADLIGAPGQPVSGQGELTLGATGKYLFTFTPSPPTMIQNFQIGSVLGNLPNIQANTPFTYVSGVKRQFLIYGILPVSGCTQEKITISFFDIAGGKVFDKTVNFQCFAAKTVLSFKNALGGSGSPTDPARFCGAGGAVRINGSGSSTASTYEIEVNGGGANVVKKTLSVTDAKSIGDYDLRNVVPPGFFKGGSTYTVTLSTYPAKSSDTKTIAFNKATPAFRMTDRTGKVFQAAAAPAANGSTGPFTVCPGKMLMDADATTCESSYFLSVQDSDAYWNRTGKNEWERWFTGKQATDVMDLNALIAAYPDGLKPPNQTFRLEPVKVNILKSTPRYFRISIATGEPSWDSRILLVRTGTPEECESRVVTTPETPCPRTDNVPWSQIGAELTRLFLSPCQYSTVPCPGGESDYEEAPYSGTPKKNFTLIYQGPLGGNPPVVDIATQDQIVAAMKAKAAQITPATVCPKTGNQKVPVGVEYQFDFTNGQFSAWMVVKYAFCAKLF
jgi:hypothetical protein